MTEAPKLSLPQFDRSAMEAWLADAEYGSDVILVWRAGGALVLLSRADFFQLADAFHETKLALMSHDGIGRL